MSNIRKTLISIALFLFFFSLISNVYAATPISSCTVINSPGEYYLTNDIINLTAYRCISIQSNNVVLDCGGHVIGGAGSSSNAGIYLYGRTNVTIRNCIVTNWYSGILLYNSNYNNFTNIIVNSTIIGIDIETSSYNILSNITVNSNFDGIYIYNSNYNTFSNITTSSNQYGIEFYGSKYNTFLNIKAISNVYNGVYIHDSSDSNIFSGIEAISNRYGVYITQSSNNTIKNSIIRGNSYCGIELYNGGIAGANLIFNNIFNNTCNFYFDGTIYTNYWNTTLTEGTNIVGGPYIGGNYWGRPDGTGYSDTCSDANKDGICDDPYTLTTNNIDYLPLAKYIPPPFLSVVFNYDSVDFGTVTPNTIAEAKSINYNVSITSSSDYKVSVNATDWSGAATIPANTLYFAVNDTLDKLSFATAKQLSNAVQLVAIFPSTVTINYHAFYFNVPVVPVGTYTATVTITYEVV